jgi:hypothetical protein
VLGAIHLELSKGHVDGTWTSVRACRTPPACRKRGMRSSLTRQSTLRATTMRSGRYRHRRQTVTGSRHAGRGHAEKE